MTNKEYLGDDVWIGESSNQKFVLLWNENTSHDTIEPTYIPKDLIGTIKDYIERVGVEK